MPIYMAYASFRTTEDIKTKTATSTLGELLPMSFGPEDLNRTAS